MDAHEEQSPKRRTDELPFSIPHLVLDAVCLLLAFGIAYLLRFRSGIPAPLGTVPWTSYLAFYAVSLPFWWLIFGYHGLYFARLREGIRAEFSRIPSAVGLASIASITLSYLIRNLPTSRLTFLFIFVSALILILLGRYIARILGMRRGVATVLILGAGPVAEVLMSRIRRRFGARTRFIHMSADDVAIKLFTSQRAAKFLEFVREKGVTDVFCLLTPSPELWEALFVLGYEGEVRVRHIPAGEGLLFGGIRYSPEFGFPQITPKSLPDFSAIRHVKRVADVIVGALGLVILSPLFGLGALLVWLSSPGPIFFRHERLGLNGKPFHVLKFRTMRQYARLTPEQEAEFKRHMKLKRDPRVTPAGTFLRKTSIDELPQLINILRGEMSLVGPRPIVPDELEKYGQWGRIFLSFPPGLTGLWQVSGRSDITYRERIDLDIYYITNWSPALDFSILIRTPGALLSRKGAY